MNKSHVQGIRSFNLINKFPNFHEHQQPNQNPSNRSDIGNSFLYEAKHESSEIFLHVWMACTFIFIIWPPSAFKNKQQNSTKKFCCCILQTIENSQESKYAYFVLFAMFVISLWASLFGIFMLDPTVRESRFLGSTIVYWSVLSITAAILRLLFTVHFYKPKNFSPDIEMIYREIFLPVQISRNDFGLILKSSKSLISVLPGQKYIQETISHVDTLSLILNGKLLISQNNTTVHTLGRFQFVDSPEWFGATSDDRFQITAVAVEKSEILVWQRENLKAALLMADPFLQLALDHIIARDVVERLVKALDVRASRPVVSVNDPATGINDFEMISRENYQSEADPKLETLAKFPLAMRQSSNNEDFFSWTLDRITEMEEVDETEEMLSNIMSTQV